MTRVLPEPDEAPLERFSFGERAAAGWRSETIRTDAWGYEARVRGQVVGEMLDRLPPDTARRIQAIGQEPGPGAAQRAERALFEAYTAPDPSAQPLPGPKTPEELSAEVDRRRRAELDEAAAVLALDGGGVAGFAGTLGRAATDPVSLALVPFGAGGSIARVAATEFALGVIGEAAVLPREFEVAGELGIENPDVLQRLLLGGFIGAGIGGGLAAGQRALQFGQVRRSAGGAARPVEAHPIDHLDDIEAAEARLDGTQAQPVRTPGEARPPQMSDFSFRRGGNADPATNRVGYVYGRLLELGYEPHVAAGLVGNLMQESGPGLNTRAVGDGGNAFGIGQWNGPRRRAYLAFAQSRGVDPGDLDTQIAWLHQEMQTTEAAAAARIRGAATAEEAALLASRHFWRPGIPHNERRAAYAADVFGQFQGGAVPRWRGRAVADVPIGGTTSRGFTGEGQVSVGDTRLEVRYEVVDATRLRQADGDLQPRDRTRSASDEQVANIAARLDPARLMPAPEADRGAPIVGPDDTIESGNGRVLALLRAAERHPDRFAAYRAELQRQGFDIPEGVEVPVLVARRQTELTPAERRDFVRAANTSTIARMSATERARSDAAGLSDAVVRLYAPGVGLTGPGNRAFVARALDTIPQAERAGLVTADGALNREGVERLNQALFARAFDAPDIVARFTETDAGELRSLLEALDRAAPGWAALRADIEAGAVRPEFDITPHVLEAMRLIANAREIARTSGTAVARVIDELLADIDLLEGPVAPLTAALVRKFWTGGRAASADSVADFLGRYAAEARRIGTTEPGLFGEAPGPLEALRAIDPEGFADVAEIGRVRGTVEPPPPPPADAPEYAEGATAPEAAEAVAEGRAGLEARLVKPQAESSPKAGFIRMYHGGFDADAGGPRWFSSNRDYAAGYGNEIGNKPLWYIDVPDSDPMFESVDEFNTVQRGRTVNVEFNPADYGTIKKMRHPVPAQPEALRAELDGLEIEMEDGSVLRARELLDDMDRDADLQAVIEACTVGAG